MFSTWFVSLIRVDNKIHIDSSHEYIIHWIYALFSLLFFFVIFSILLCVCFCLCLLHHLGFCFNVFASRHFFNFFQYYFFF